MRGWWSTGLLNQWLGSGTPCPVWHPQDQALEEVAWDDSGNLVCSWNYISLWKEGTLPQDRALHTMDIHTTPSQKEWQAPHQMHGPVRLAPALSTTAAFTVMWIFAQLSGSCNWSPVEVNAPHPQDPEALDVITTWAVPWHRDVIGQDPFQIGRTHSK